ncbi:phosphoethanolamine--lipid A transferase [Desulfocicer niacini]
MNVRMRKDNYFSNQMTSTRLIILSAVFFIIFSNIAFFSNVIQIYPISAKNIGFLLSLVWGCGGLIVLVLSLLCFRYTIKPVLILLFPVSSMAAYFMDTYNIIIDETMIQNILNTDMAESLDLLSLKLILYVIFTGLLPAFFVYKSKIVSRSRWQASLSRIKLFVFTLLSVVALMFAFSDFYTSFFREHKPLRYYANPSYYLYSSGKYIHGLFKTTSSGLKQVGLDATIPVSDVPRKLVIFVIGEAARADRFSLNGYERETTPLLKQEDVISFTNFWSCGTTTAVSVPCMFSIYKRSAFNDQKGKTTENVLDVLNHAGVNLLWLENNSNSLKVAGRIPYHDYKTSATNAAGDIEFRDVSMLENLQSYVEEQQQGDIFIVLHQMGNHGPAYYKRYPPEFERFTPVCKSNQLEECSTEDINNAYDNAILYTDYFLSRVIGFLKQNQTSFDTAMLYVGDHGESLGENGLYLHGLPYLIAPDNQRHVPAVFWFGEHFKKIDRAALLRKRDHKYSHDYLFHTILGLMDVETAVYDHGLDILTARD